MNKPKKVFRIVDSPDPAKARYGLLNEKGLLLECHNSPRHLGEAALYHHQADEVRHDYDNVEFEYRARSGI
jgi:hypothetical protein